MQNSSKLISNLIWRFAERIGAQGVNFVVSIVLARLLTPKDYGVISLITIFISILNVFVDGGLANSLIQKKNADDLDFSSVFYFNIIWCTCLYIMLFLLAPAIATFYSNNALIPLIRVLGTTILISGVKNVQIAYVSKTMQFKSFFYATLGGTIFSAVIGIFMAYLGFGPWALIAQQLSNTLIDTIILWFTVKWRPKKCFSFNRLKRLVAFGFKLLFSGLLESLYNNLRQLIIGKKYSSVDLAYYNKGDSLPHLIITNLNSAIDSVLFPAMSNIQDEPQRVKALTRKSISLSSYIVWPAVIGLAACSDSLIRILLTEKWSECIPYLRIFCISYGFYPVHTANLNAIKAMGRSDIFLSLEIKKKIIGITLLLFSLNYGAMGIALSMLILAPMSAIINASPNKRLIDYSYREQFHDILTSFLLALTMGMLVYSVQLLDLGLWVTLIVQVVVGVVSYVVLSFITKNESFIFLFNIIKTKLL